MLWFWRKRRSTLETLYERIDASENNKSVGSGEAFYVADSQTKVLMEALEFGQATTVLDYGCGIGRTMPMLFEKTGKRLQLDGCDISQQFIDECRALYTAYPFRFYKIFAENPHYTRYDVSQREDKLPDGYYDLAYSFSVFTHLNLEMAAPTLARLHACLKPQGRYYFTMFRLDESTINMINAGTSPVFGFSNRVEDSAKEFFAHDSDPFAFVALPSAAIEEKIHAAGFRIVRFIPGTWRGITASNVHDAYVIEKSGS